MPDEQVLPDADPQAVVVAFLAALERLDLDAALLLVSDDIVYQNVPLPPARGRAAAERTLRQMLRHCTGFEARVHHIAANGPTVLTERTDVLRIGSWEAEFWVCGTFEVRAGRVVLWRDYFDWATFIAAGVRGAGKALLGRLTPRAVRHATGPAERSRRRGIPVSHPTGTTETRATNPVNVRGHRTASASAEHTHA